MSRGKKNPKWPGETKDFVDLGYPACKHAMYLSIINIQDSLLIPDSDTAMDAIFTALKSKLPCQRQSHRPFVKVPLRGKAHD